MTPGFFGPFSRKPPVPSTCEAYRELIEQGLTRGRNGKAIWQDLVSEYGYAGSYQAVKRFVQRLRGPRRPEPAGIILTGPGEEAQVDYGRPFVSIIECRGPKLFASYFTKWHALAHLITLTP